MATLQNAKRIVIKVGTSTLTHENGRPNIRRIEKMVRAISDLRNQGKEIVLVTSGAIGVGVGKLGLKERPTDVNGRQALAAVGQCELMFLYDKLFSEYGHAVAQVLLTRDVIDDAHRKENVVNTFNALLEMNVTPIVNENDTVAIDELTGHNIGDNDNLSAIVAVLIEAEALILLTDIDGLYDRNPRENPEAVRIPVVLNVDENVRKLAGGTGSARGTGGMVTKLDAAETACSHGIETYIMSGLEPEMLYRLFDGEQIGTHFVARGK